VQSKAPAQVPLPLPPPPKRRGGKRAGAGRKPTPRPGQLPHRRVRKRPAVSPRDPVHVVLRVTREVGRLRRRSAYQAIRRAMQTALAKRAVRIVHVSLQRTHIHLLVEAADETRLARGMQGFAIAAARYLNRAVAADRRLPQRRRGQVFVTRYHAEIITSPRKMRHCLSYVLNNWRRHREHLGVPALRRARVDPFSSGIAFDGWNGLTAPFVVPAGYQPLPVASPRCWLLTTGWKRYGAIGFHEIPGP
jgi:REP element-mobilizing transposase RayT